MKRTLIAAILVLLILSPIGCGHDHGGSPQIISTFIISDAAFDGDIEQISANVFSITTIAGGAQSVFAGINPATSTEFRAFLDFPLTGPDGVPGNALIDSAFLNIGINNVSLQSGNTIPILIDLIEIQSSTLKTSDYDRPPLASITLNIFQTDIGNFVKVDVTSLMIEAQNRGLSNFRIRILEDLGPVIPGIIEINDSTAAAAPQLKVNYY